MKIKFKIFRPMWEYQQRGPSSCNVCISPDIQLNEWLAENPKVEIINWQATPVGTSNELYITIQYRELEA